MKRILCIGEALIDMICTDKEKPLSEGLHFIKKAGGAPTNVAAAIASFGGKVDLLAKVGNDPFGQHLIDELASFNVSTKWILKDNDHFTTLAFVSLMQNGERDFYFNRGADSYLNTSEIDMINVEEYSIIHFGSATAFLPGPLQAAYKKLLQHSGEKNIYISFDPNYRSLLFQNDKQSFIEQSWNFLERCDFFKVSDEEALMLTEKNTVNEAAAFFQSRLKSVFAITLGSNGALLGINDKAIHIPGIKINPVDTTGAGDAFVGAVLYQLSQKKVSKAINFSVSDWEEVMLYGNKAGAKVCEYFGAMEALKHLNTLFQS